MQPTTFPASRPFRPRLLAAALLGVTLAVALAVPAAAAPGDGGWSPFAWIERAWTAIFGASGGSSGPGPGPDGAQAPVPDPGDFGPDMDPNG